MRSSKDVVAVKVRRYSMNCNRGAGWLAVYGTLYLIE